MISLNKIKDGSYFKAKEKDDDEYIIGKVSIVGDIYKFLNDKTGSIFASAEAFSYGIKVNKNEDLTDHFHEFRIIDKETFEKLSFNYKYALLLESQYKLVIEDGILIIGCGDVKLNKDQFNGFHKILKTMQKFNESEIQAFVHVWNALDDDDGDLKDLLDINPKILSSINRELNKQ